MDNLFSDLSTYKVITRNPLSKLQSNTHKILKDLNDNKFLNYQFHNNQLTMTNTTLPKGYGLPKIHKENVPFRPIISLVNSPTHFLAKTLYDQLKHSIICPKSNVKNSFDLKDKLKNVHIPDNHVLLSLDNSSLFTNVPCNLVVESLEKRVTQIQNNCKIPFSDVINCIKFLFDNTYFVFNEKIYQKIYGTPMGSLISPLFADIVMDDLETHCLDLLFKKFNCKPVFYYRYVDDSIICIPKD